MPVVMQNSSAHAIDRNISLLRARLVPPGGEKCGSADEKLRVVSAEIRIIVTTGTPRTQGEKAAVEWLLHRGLLSLWPPCLCGDNHST